MDMIFAAQLWKDNSGRLENKNGDWMYMEETWILPNDTKTKEQGQNLSEDESDIIEARMNQRHSIQEQKVIPTLFPSTFFTSPHSYILGTI